MIPPAFRSGLEETMTQPTGRFAIVLTTAGSEEQANTLAQELVERRLAACVNILPQVASVYRWKGKIWRDEEKLLVIKTLEENFAAVREAIRELHSYELPEALLLPIADADPGIAAWIRECLGPPQEEAADPEEERGDDILH
jgi:periplasmic divalent cation tolerance protein